MTTIEDVGGHEAAVADGETAAEEPEAHEEHHKHWYVVKVQSGREDTIKDAIERRRFARKGWRRVSVRSSSRSRR